MTDLTTIGRDVKFRDHMRLLMKRDPQRAIPRNLEISQELFSLAARRTSHGKAASTKARLPQRVIT
jgi:hypothetical protein